MMHSLQSAVRSGEHAAADPARVGLQSADARLQTAREHERAKYLALASRPGSTYGSTNHGSGAAALVLGWKPRFVVDFGCGRNLFIAELRRRGVDGLGVDFAFPEADIQRPMHATGLLDAVADVVTSFDAIEHLLPEDVDPVLAEMRRIARPRAWFCLSFCPHASRTTVNGEGLHPTVRPIAWWVERLRRVGSVHETRAAGRYITGRFVESAVLSPQSGGQRPRRTPADSRLKTAD